MDSQYKTKLTHALVRMLRPLIRLCLRHEVTNAELNELVRLMYVEVAYERYSIPEVEMTASRAAVLSGLSRKEVVRLREVLEQGETLPKQSPNRAQRVVHGWLNDAEFSDDKGLPLTLPVKQKHNGKEHGSFVSLVKRYSGDVTYGAILDELNHIGVTEQPNEQTVALVNYAYVPHKDDLEQVRVASTSVADLFNTALHNIDSDIDDKRFQRQVVYSHIDESLVDELQEIVAVKGQELLESLGARMAQAKKQSNNGESSRLKRVGFGMYYLENDSKPVTNPKQVVDSKTDKEKSDKKNA